MKNQESVLPLPIGKLTGKNHIGKAGGPRKETGVEKIDRKSKEVLRILLESQKKQLAISEVRSRALEKRMALQSEIEKEVLDPNFFQSLEDRDKISFWRALNSSNQKEVDFIQKSMAQGDFFQFFHNFKRALEALNFLEQETRTIPANHPFSPEFKSAVKDALLKRVMGITHDPEVQPGEEEENGGQKMD